MTPQPVHDAPPTRRDVLLVGILPTTFALLVAAVILIERFQLDVSQLHSRLRPRVWLLFLVVFGLAHIAGALRAAPLTLRQRAFGASKALAFLLFHTPFTALSFGAYFIFLQAAPLTLLLIVAGGDPSLAPQPYEQTILYRAFVWQLAGLSVILPFVLPGIAFGLLLAASAGSPWRLSRTDRKRVHMIYGLGGAAASTVFLGMVLSIAAVDNNRISLFSPAFAWIDAFAIYVATIICCGALWLAALQSAWKSGSILRSQECRRGLRILILLALALVVMTQLAASEDLTIFGNNADGRNLVAGFIRSGQPTLSADVNFHGAHFSGPRSALVSRDPQGNFMILRDSRWSPPGGDSDIRLETQAHFGPRPLDCLTLTASRTLCADLGKANAAPQAHWAGIRVFEYDAAIPEAFVTRWVRKPWDRPTSLSDLKAVRAAHCDVGLSSVPTDGVYVWAAITCGDDWPADALRLRSMVNSWFVAVPK